MRKVRGNEKDLDELLVEALVPEDEQPYEVPENWVWTKLGKVAVINPSRFVPSNLEDDFQTTFIPMNAVSEISGAIETPVLRDYKDVKKGYTNFLEGDVLFAKITPCMENGKVAIAKNLANGFGFGSTEFHVLRASKAIENKLIYYLVRSENFRKQAKEVMTGAVGQQRVHKNFLVDYPFTLAPLPEQKRIIDKLESLFGKINEAKQLIKEARETFTDRRAAILAQAFRGELTKKWRKEHPNVEPAEKLLQRIKAEREKFEISRKGRKKNEELPPIDPPYKLPEGWCWVRLIDVTKFKSGYAFDSSDFVNEGFQLIRMGNLTNAELDLSKNPVYLPYDYDKNIVEKYSIKNGDILLTLTGTKYKRDYGYAVTIEDQDNTLLLNQRILSLTPLILGTYLKYYLHTSVFRDMFFSFETGGVNQGNVSSKAVETIPLPLPPLKEGIEIERVLTKLLLMEKWASKELEIDNEVESIKQSILSKAFRGELGTSDPEDESALELLKQVLISNQDLLNQRKG